MDPATIAFAIFLLLAAGAIVAYVNRNPASTTADKAKGKSAKAPKKESVLVSLWNGTGARELNSKTTGGAFAELTGRATGSTVRGTRRATAWSWKKAKSTGKTAAEKAETRWSDRRTEPGKPPVWKAPADSKEPSGDSTPGPPPTPNPADAAPAVPVTPTEPPARAPEPTPGRTEGKHMASYKNLFESGQAIARQPFIGIFNFQHFNRSVKDGTYKAGGMYLALAERLGGPVNLDPIVTNPIRECTAHQQAIAGLIGDADTELTKLLNSNMNDLLERHANVPREVWLDNGGSHSSRVPEFFETVTTLAGRQHEDIRDVHCLIKALSAASEQQAIMYRQMAARLRDKNLRSLAERYEAAANHQNAITEKLTVSDANLQVILSMALRELAASNLKAPNAHLINA